MKFSIITPSLNQGEFIKDCIESVLSQNYNNFEHIIVDGGSTDNTINIIKNYSHLKLLTGSDSGPASAINRGFKVASGDILAWLNCDDYYDSNVFEKILNVFKSNLNVKFVYGNLTFVNKEKKIVKRDKTKRFNFNSLINISPDIRQPCSFYKKGLVEQVQYLNENIKIVFDLDFFIKMSKISEPYYIDENLAFYRDHDSTLTRVNIRKQGWEIYKVCRKYNAKLFTPVTRLILYRLIKGNL